MDGMLPPVDMGGWLDLQRRRAEQAARQRIAAAGAGAGDWIGRATSTLDTLVPDWPTPAPPPPPPPPEPEPEPPMALPSPAAQVGDWAQGALARIGQIGSDVGSATQAGLQQVSTLGGRVPTAQGLQDFSDRQAAALNAKAAEYQARRPESPEALAALQGFGEEVPGVLGRSRERVGEQLGLALGPGRTLPQRAGGVFGVATAPFAEPIRINQDLAAQAGGLPETQAAAGASMAIAGPGGLVSSLGGASALPGVMRYAPGAGAIIGGAGGLATGIASGAPPEEVISRTAEGASAGAGLGELAGNAPKLYRGTRQLLGNLAERYGTVADGPVFGIGSGAPLRQAPVDERRLAIWAPGRGYVEGQPGDRMHTDISRRFFQETGERLPATSVRVDVRPASPDGVRPPEIALSPLDQTPSLTQERAALRAAIAEITKDTPADWRLSVMLNDMSEYKGRVGDGAAGLRRVGHYSTRQDYGDDVFGIRRGQRGLRAPRLTAAEQAGRTLDDAAEERVFQAIQNLWRRDRADEADDLRLLALGKGRAGEDAARLYLAEKGLEDVLPAAPAGTGAGLVPAATEPGDGVLARTLSSLQPYGAATTRGERAFDLATGTAGGVLGAATADEDAPWQERAKRFAIGATGASLLGPTARAGLGLAARNGSEAMLGAAAGAAPVGPGRGRVTWSDIPELMGAIPLIAPTSQLANFTSGMARTLERVAGVAFEGRPIDALTDLSGMVRSLPGAGRKIKEAYQAGPTQWNPGMTGAQTAGDLASRGGLLPGAATSGTRANAALDEFWRTVNEAGAVAQANRRGLGAADTARVKQSAGDFATWGGPNSAVAKKLSELKAIVRDPEAGLLDKSIGAAVTSFAPYVMMPERLIRATIGNLIPVEAGIGMARALKRGDKVAAREFRGRMLAGMAATTALTVAYYHGGITGDAPRDANERRRREAQGEQWNTFTLPTGQKLPTRYLGSLGMQANAVATTLDAARRAQAQGGDPGAVLENGYNAAWRWGLHASYLSDLADFVDAVNGPQGAAEGTRDLLAGQPSRFTGPLTNIIGAADPYERQNETLPEKVANRTGLRFLSPTRIDPATGADQRRQGTGWSRYWGERGDVQSDEAGELARVGVQPRVLGRTEEFEGARPTPAQRRAAQRALGSETNRAVREAMAKPDYAALSDEEKKSRLQAAMKTAADRADLVLGEGVTRGTKQQAQRAWDAVPHFVGVSGSADEIRRKNAEISKAMTVASQYREKYGEAGWRDRMSKEEPEAFRLASTPRLPAELQKRQREQLEKQYGVKLG